MEDTRGFFESVAYLPHQISSLRNMTLGVRCEFSNCFTGVRKTVRKFMSTLRVLCMYTYTILYIYI